MIVTAARRSVEVLSYFLKSEGLPHVPLHGERLKSKERDAALLGRCSPWLLIAPAVLKTVVTAR